MCFALPQLQKTLRHFFQRYALDPSFRDEEALASRSVPQGNLTLEGFHAMLNALSAGSEGLPNLPTESFTRESFYEDRA